MTTVDNRAALIAGLRQLADFLDTHPAVPTPPHPHLTWSGGGTLDLDDESGPAYIRDLADVLGVEPRDLGEGFTTADRKFGPIRYGASYQPRSSAARYAATLSYDGAVEPETVGFR